tara:strand:- start:52 stop:594 length:543 start_codon:yes stop_codon:yes gene_type:complete
MNNSMNNKNTANIISVIPLLIIIYYILNLIYTIILHSLGFKTIDLFQKFKNVFGLLCVTSTIQLFKYIIPYPKKWHNITMRPNGACDCDYLSSKGVVINKCGMPSGHMGTTSFFAVSNIIFLIKTIKINNQTNLINTILICLNLGLIITMGWARIVKLCHNLPQVILGTFYGSIISYLFY